MTVTARQPTRLRLTRRGLDHRAVREGARLLNAGLEEVVEHSYRENWDAATPRFRTAPLGNPLSPYHPWNKDTRVKPTGRRWRENHTSDTAPRWDRLMVEAGAYARIWSETRVSEPHSVPKDKRIVVGFWVAGRGHLAHHLAMDNGVLTNYQLCSPSTQNASPCDPWGQRGPYQEAALNTPILEEFGSLDEYKGIDILRTIRSFDPCMPCTTHVDAGQRAIVREVSTCTCIIEEQEPVSVR